MAMRFAPFASAAMLGLCIASSGDAAPPRPMYVTIPANAPSHRAPVHPGSQLTQWNGSFIDQLGYTINYTMIGTDPSSTNTTTTTQVVIIPVRMVYGSGNGNRTFDPKKAYASNGKSVIRNAMISPLFKSVVDFDQGGTNLGKTQYIDAFQRGNFWSDVHTNSAYHVLLGAPVMLKEQVVNVSSSQGQVISNPFGSGVVGTMDIYAFDADVQNWISALTSINPGVLPIFFTYDIYLTEGGDCCIGGYHSANAGQPDGQTYAYSTYEDSVGSFSQDVSALSHEIGEWQDDPFVDNYVNCQDNSLLEVGDPLVNQANYGAYGYTYKGFTYNLQSLVFIGYFGAPRSTSVNTWLAFQNDESNLCPGQ